MRGRRLVIALGLLLIPLLHPLVASGHATLLLSDPAGGSTLSRSPALVRLVFSEAVQGSGPAVVVYGPSGRRVERGPPRAQGSEAIVAIRADGQGAYLVRWSVVAADTHPTGGSFTFTVGHAGGPFSNAPGRAGGLTLGDLVGVAARWLHLAGYALAFGPVAFEMVALRPRALLLADGPIGRRLWRLVTAGLIALLLAEPLALLAQALSLSATAPLEASLLGSILASGAGRALGQRLGAALGLWALIGLARAGATQAPAAILALGLGLAVISGQTSHALDVTAVAPALSLGVNALHVAAMGLWLGGLIALLAVWPLTPPPSRAALTVRFGRLAALALGALGCSGVALAVLHVGGVAGLVGGAYGRVLLAKTALACAGVALALRGARAGGGGPTWWRREVAALAGVLALAALMIALPPPS